MGDIISHSTLCLTHLWTALTPGALKIISAEKIMRAFFAIALVGLFVNPILSSSAASLT